MPTYGYQCTQCKHEFSLFQSMKDDPVRVCPECSGDVKRLLYPVGIVFKGTGWYVNDSRKPDTSDGGSASAAAEKKDGDSKSGEAGSESKSDAKGDGKVETKAESAAPKAEKSLSGAPNT